MGNGSGEETGREAERGDVEAVEAIASRQTQRKGELGAGLFNERV